VDADGIPLSQRHTWQRVHFSFPIGSTRTDITSALFNLMKDPDAAFCQ